jgi:hypothetical protein
MGEVHGDAAGGDVDGVDPGEDEGDEDGFGTGRLVGEFDGEEGGGVFEAGASVGAGGEFQVGDDAGGGVGGGGVVEGAAEQVADEEGAGVEGRELVGGDEELLAGEEFGGADAVAAGELEDDAAGVLAGGQEVLFDVEGKRVGRGRGCVGGREEDFAVGREEAGKIAEGVGEELAAAPLRAQQTSDGKPVRGGDAVQCCEPLRKSSRRGWASVSLGLVVVVVGLGIARGTIGLDDIEREAALQLHAGGAEDGSQGTRGAALFADDFADVRGGDMEAKDGGFLFGKSFDTD